MVYVVGVADAHVAIGTSAIAVAEPWHGSCGQIATGGLRYPD
jgi:hypothetical protein